MAVYRQWREEKRTPLRDVVPLATPYNLLFETSSLCNLDCIYCAHSKHVYPEKNMDMDLFKRALEQTHDFPDIIKKAELYFLGEPLCHPQLADMVALVRQSGTVDQIDFTTNGLLFTKERVDEFKEKGMPNTIRISLQGLDEETYFKICGRRIDFGRFIDNLTYLYKNKGNCTISMKVADIAIKAEERESGKEKLEALFGEIADTLFVETIIPIYSDVNYDDIDDEIKHRAINGREAVEQKKVNIVCHRPFYRLAVKVNGDITAACCDSVHDVVYGNINNGTLAEHWDGKKRTEFLKLQLRKERFRYPLCEKCVLPNDITNEADLLDPYAGEVLEKFQ